MAEIEICSWPCLELINQVSDIEVVTKTVKLIEKHYKKKGLIINKRRT